MKQIFSDKAKIGNGVLTIDVKERKIIQTVILNGVKAEKNKNNYE